MFHGMNKCGRYTSVCTLLNLLNFHRYFKPFNFYGTVQIWCDPWSSITSFLNSPYADGNGLINRNSDSYPLSTRGLGPYIPISGSASDPSMIPNDKTAKVISNPVARNSFPGWSALGKSPPRFNRWLYEQSTLFMFIVHCTFIHFYLFIVPCTLIHIYLFIVHCTFFIILWVLGGVVSTLRASQGLKCFQNSDKK